MSFLLGRNKMFTQKNNYFRIFVFLRLKNVCIYILKNFKAI